MKLENFVNFAIVKQGRGVSTITFQWQRELQRRKLKKARGTIQIATTTEQATNQKFPTSNKQVHYEKQTTGQESTTLDTLAQIPRHAGNKAQNIYKSNCLNQDHNIFKTNLGQSLA
ncbi:unnamed protein product [Ceutorhynchus assimilis]|uniref:Uncharacterized protein n=1 Tax=Ceutorhynchus assimilis TaxID=467358 RepID=A0A9N9MT72_9CUCU|nr:unnamed protein product [Ceutorhynchus assimilis]